MFKKHNNLPFQQFSQIDYSQRKKQYKYEFPLKKPSKNNFPSQKQNHSYHTMIPTNMLKGNAQEQHNIVFQTDDYIELQGVLSKQVQIINENINILHEKNYLKNKQIQALANNINKMTQKSKLLQDKIKQKHNKLSNIQVKYKQVSQQVLFQQQKLKKQQLILNEQLQKCSIFSQNIEQIQSRLLQSSKEVDYYQKRLQKFDDVQQQNINLKQYLQKLQEQQKLIQQEDIYQQNQCNQLSQKLQSLKNVYNERSRINNRNLVKLNQLKTEVANMTRAKQNMNKKQHQIKFLQMERGDLNQELLLINEEISQLDFRIRKRDKTIKELKAKLNERKNQKSYLTYDPIQQNQTPKQSYRVVQSQNQQIFQKIVPKSIRTSKNNSNSAKQAKVQTKNNSPFVIKTNITPTFTPHEQQKTSSRVQQGQSLQDSDAFKNIEKLISRFEQIKTKQKYKT